MGRTPLAANWMDQDRYHSSGHLLASGAARELLVSTFLDAAGGAASLVACEAVLARELPPGAAAWVAEMRPPELPLCPADLHLQAISVKDGHFARLSNFLWALDHFDAAPGWLAEYFLAVRRALGPDETLTMADVSPADIAQAFADSFQRGLGHFATYRRLGIDWGSYHNNFTADGRFLDLEVPLVLGQPFIGWLGRDGADVRRGKWMGADAGRYVRQMRDFLVAFRARLAGLPAHRFSDVEMEFVGEVVRELDEVVPPGHILFDQDALADHLVATLARELHLPARAREVVGTIVDDSLSRRGQLDDDVWQSLDLRELPQRFRPAEAGPDFVLRVPAVLLEHLEPGFELGRRFDRLVRACDQATSLTAYFDALERGRQILADSLAQERAHACG
jgi:hypothetical protein